MDSGTIIAFAGLIGVVIAIAVLLSRMARDGNEERDADRGHLAKIELHRAQAAERARRAEAAADAAEPVPRRPRSRRFSRDPQPDPAQEPERRA